MALSQTNAEPAPIIFDAQDQKMDKTFYLKKIRWIGSTASGNECVLKDYGASVTYWHAYAAGSLADIETDFTGLMGGALRASGLQLTTFDAGKLYLYG